MEGSTHISLGDVHRHGDAFHTKSGHTLHALWTQKRSPSRQPQLALAKSVCNHRAQQLRQATPTCWRLGYSLPHKTFDIVGHHVWIQPNSLRCPQFCAQLPLQFCFPCAAAARPPLPLTVVGNCCHTAKCRAPLSAKQQIAYEFGITLQFVRAPCSSDDAGLPLPVHRWVSAPCALCGVNLYQKHKIGCAFGWAL